MAAMLSLTASTPAAARLQARGLERPELSPRDRNWLVGAVAGAHLLGLWAVLQVPAVRDAVREVAPLVVDLVTVPPPPAQQRPPPLSPPLPPQPALKTPPKPVPVAPPSPQIMAAPALETPAPQAFTAPPPVPVVLAPAVVQAVAQPVVAAQAAPAPPPAPPAPPRKVVSANAVRYLVEPPVEVPRASRRAGEHGTVWLRVVVSTQGLPALVSVARSSGHSRLDEQALWAMRQARFKPHTEDGRAIEVEVTAPIEYPLE